MPGDQRSEGGRPAGPVEGTASTAREPYAPPGGERAPRQAAVKNRVAADARGALRGAPPGRSELLQEYNECDNCGLFSRIARDSVLLRAGTLADYSSIV